MSELAEAERIAPTQRWRARVGPDLVLPGRVAIRLADEYDLMVVQRASDWRWLIGQLDLAAGDLDFRRGQVVGIIARLGERRDGQWPISIRHVRVLAGVGWMYVRFEMGLYYPIQGPAFAEFAYVPGLKRLGRVQINQRMFDIRTASEHE